jgi:hypothetical protein
MRRRDPFVARVIGVVEEALPSLPSAPGRARRAHHEFLRLIGVSTVAPLKTTVRVFRLSYSRPVPLFVVTEKVARWEPRSN